MIPTRDNLGDRGPIPVTLVLIPTALVLLALGELPEEGLFQVVLSLMALWVFGSTVERRLGSLLYAIVLVVAAVASGLLVAAAIGDGRDFVLDLFFPVLAVAAIHIAMAPQARVVCIAPVPFAVSFLEVPAWIVALVWVALEVLFDVL